MLVSPSAHRYAIVDGIPDFTAAADDGPRQTWRSFGFKWTCFEDNVHVNFDWYHPRYAHRHTPDEVRGWLRTLDPTDEHCHVSDSGISVIARKT